MKTEICPDSAGPHCLPSAGSASFVPELKVQPRLGLLSFGGDPARQYRQGPRPSLYTARDGLTTTVLSHSPRRVIIVIIMMIMMIVI